MAYKKNIFKDKTVVTVSVISVVAAAALIGGMALDSKNNNKNKNTNEIVDLNNEETRYDSSSNYPLPFDDNELSNNEEEPTTKIPQVVEEPTTIPENETSNSTEISVNAPAKSLNFTSSSILTWPVDGNIIIDYDMDNTVYFPTLDLYKCSDSICIQSDVGTPVYASSKCVVKEVATNEEIGTYVVVDLGNGYLLKYGQLKDIAITLNDTLEEGDLIGYVNQPTRFYSIEGPNLLLNLTKDGEPVNPLDYLNYE